MKGVSPLLATVLLVAGVVAIATLVMGWLSQTVKATQATVTNRTAEGVDCTAAGLVIDDLYVSGTGTTATVRAIVRNSGQIDGLTLSAAQLFNTSGANFSTSSSLGDLNKGGIANLVFNASLAACPSSFSKLIVTTADCGALAATFSGTPKCS